MIATITNFSLMGYNHNSRMINNCMVMMSSMIKQEVKGTMKIMRRVELEHSN